MEGLSYMTAFRHISLVLDAADDSLTVYLDGTPLGEPSYFEPGYIGSLDCDSTADTYIGLGHRSPGASPMEGDIQDFRMYVGQVRVACA